MLLLPKVLTQAHASAFLAAQLPALRAEDGVVQADASALQQFDSSALAVLLEIRRETLALGKRFEVLGMPVRLAELAGLYGIADLLRAA